MKRQLHVWLSALVLALASACIGSNYGPDPEVPTAPSPRPAPATPATKPTKRAFAPFVVPSAEPERKQRVVVLSAEIDRFLQERLSKNGPTGLAVGILVDGELVYSKGLGVQDVETKVPVDIDSVFRIASLTKSFTALAVLKLRDEGKLQLDEPLATYLPELAALRPPTSDSPPITARLLLTHQGGLPWDDLWGRVNFGMNDDQLNALVKEGLSFAGAPGAQWDYSNLGYALLGRLVERVSGVPFRAYVNTEILAPLGMTATYWESGDVPPARLTVGYRREGDATIAEPRDAMGAFDPAGGLYTSLRDYARYIAFQLQAYPPRNDPEQAPVRRSTLREMHRGQAWTRLGPRNAPVARRAGDAIELRAHSYGFAWENVTTCSDEERIQHSGWEPGYFAGVIMAPRRGVAVISLATTAPARVIEPLLKLIEERGAAPIMRGVRATPELLAAQAAVTRLLAEWDDALAERTFDPAREQGWLATLRARFAKLAVDHGKCRPEESFDASTALHGRWSLRCERGAVAVDIALTPSSSPHIHWLELEETFEPARQLTQTASRLVQSIGRASARGREQLIASVTAPAAKSQVERELSKLSIDHDACTLGKPLASDGTTNARFGVQCGATALEASLTVDLSTSLVSAFEIHQPRDPNALCWH